MQTTEKHPPINVNDLIQLTDIGIPSKEITWSRVSMLSDQWICIRHSKNNDSKSKASSLTVVNLQQDCQYSSYDGGVTDSVLMHPAEPIIALKACMKFEVFNLDTKTLISKTTHHEQVLFWTWVNADIIGIVTDTAVYHWSLWQEDSSPEKIFTRHHRLAFTEIVSYQADPALKWLAVTGISPEEDRITGITQLYSVEEEITQCISSHAVCFALYKFADNPYPSTTFCVGSRDTQDHGKVHVIELRPYQKGNFAPRSSYDHIQFRDDFDKYDFPMSMQVSSKYGLLFMITKYSYLYICDMETAVCLSCTRITMDIIFAATLNTKTQSILGITRSGHVISVDLKKDNLLSNLRDIAKLSNQASRLEKAILSS